MTAITKKLNKTSEIKLKRTSRSSYIYKEVQDDEVINKCLTARCGRLFRAKIIDSGRESHGNQVRGVWAESGKGDGTYLFNPLKRRFFAN